MYLLKQQNWGGGHFCNLKLVNLKQLKYGTGHCVEWCRGQWLQINKIEIWRKLQKKTLIMCIGLDGQVRGI